MPATILYRQQGIALGKLQADALRIGKQTDRQTQQDRQILIISMLVPADEEIGVFYTRKISFSMLDSPSITVFCREQS